VSVELDGDGCAETGVPGGGFAGCISAVFFFGLEEAGQVFCRLLFYIRSIVVSKGAKRQGKGRGHTLAGSTHNPSTPTPLINK